jgi:two-component system sensor histidine kinase KdpD
MSRPDPDRLLARVAEPSAAAGVPPAPPARRGYWQALLAVAITTVLSRLLLPVLQPTNLAMIFLLGVVLVAMQGARGPAVLAAVLSVAAFDFFCVPPYLTFVVSDPQYLLTFAVMFGVAMVISTLTLSFRQQAQAADERAKRTEALYRLSHQMAGSLNAGVLVEVITAITAETFRAKVAVLLPNADGGLAGGREWRENSLLDASEQAVARWVLDHGQPAGHGTPTLPGARALYLPLTGSEKTVGVLGILPSGWEIVEDPEQFHLLETFASQAALALERAEIARQARQAEIQAEAERLRTSLLSAVSHDLRTPLASITGAATGLLAQAGRLDQATSRELLQTISDEADRLNRLVTNLLEITRLESGAVEVRKEWHPLEEILGAALKRTERQLGNRPIRLDLPADLPMVAVDDVLLEQAFINLLDNAAKYTPAGSAIEIRARAAGEMVEVEVRDSGPGFPPGAGKQVFDKFYRGAGEAARGAGLGLAIVKAIIDVHGGQIEALNHPQGGACLRFTLPAAVGVPSAAALREQEHAG